jgi:hypothetical protein
MLTKVQVKAKEADKKNTSLEDSRDYWGQLPGPCPMTKERKVWPGLWVHE